MFNNYIELKIVGKDVKRFIKQLNKMHIYFENIDFTNNTVYVKVDRENYDKIMKVKTIYKVSITKLYGFYRIKDIIKRYNIFFMSLIASVIVLNILTNMIFEIEVESDDEDISNLILNELEDYGIKKYTFNKSYQKREEILSSILDDNKDSLEWLEIERVGVKYIVHVEERIINEEKETCENRHIVASRDGLIISINASSGEIKKSVNDYVKKGDILISGIITKDEEEVSRVCAKGQVFAEVWYQVSVEVPYNYQEVKYTRNTKYNLSITLFNKRYPLFSDYDNYEIEEYSLSNSLLPLKLSFEKNREIVNIDEIYTMDEVLLKAIDIARQKLLLTLNENDEIILEKKLKTEAKDSTIEVVIFFKVKEDITSFQEISKEGLDEIAN